MRVIVFREPSCTLGISKITTDEIKQRLHELVDLIDKGGATNLAIHGSFCKNSECMWNLDDGRIYDESRFLTHEKADCMGFNYFKLSENF